MQWHWQSLQYVYTFLPLLNDVLILLQITCCLHEFQTGSFKAVDFSLSTYGLTYLDVIQLIGKVKANKYHGQRFKKCKKEWARGAV